MNAGKYEKGQKAANNILRAAEELLIDEGYQSLSIRKIASRCGITPGNLQYYFPSKDVLLESLLNRIIRGYLEEFERLRQDAGIDPVMQLKAVLTHVIKDLNSKRTTHFFPEVWALSNHESSITQSLDEMYGAYRDVIQEIILKKFGYSTFLVTFSSMDLLLISVSKPGFIVCSAQLTIGTHTIRESEIHSPSSKPRSTSFLIGR